MYSKIDDSLKKKIITLKKDSSENVELIVNVANIEKAISYIEKFAIGKIIPLPIVSAVAFTAPYSKVLSIAKSENVKRVSASFKVCSMVYASKKIVGTNSLEKSSVQEFHSVVVIDTGIYPHIDFCLGKNRIIKFVDLINGRDVPYDDNGHGTFVSGVLGGNSIVSKYSGFDNKCNLIVIKAIDSDGETSSIKILQAMQWVLDNSKKFNIKVVCMSFGSVLSTGVDALMYGAEILWDNGIVVVSAGGNSGPDSATIMSPGASRKIITVGSMTKTLDGYKVADFSSRGPAFNYYKPDMVVPGVDIISCNVFSKTNKKFYTTMSGTSVSTPMVAGVASLMLGINPKLTPQQIKYILVNSCKKITGDRNAEGFGRLDLSGIKIF